MTPYGKPKAAGKLLLNRHKEELLYTPYGFTGGSHDFYNGLIYLRARCYDPEVGNFISRDSYLGELLRQLSQNRYTYAENNPVNYTDPSGHDVGWAAAGWSDPYTPLNIAGAGNDKDKCSGQGMGNGVWNNIKDVGKSALDKWVQIGNSISKWSDEHETFNTVLYCNNTSNTING